ncbi:PEP/pyruvate-binding domain-containing protein [Micromonospora sp. CPCC 205539]|uniref:PEP/pyruvate-binding domain-containing protein n=1 Tax=Micromonospora sp. CPCC 205539 TaxID=3122408 RepID=UPI002FF36475
MTSDVGGAHVIRSLRRELPPQRRSWGEKAWNLRRLAEAGIAVPPAVVVPADVPLPSPAELRAALGVLFDGPTMPDRAPLAIRSSAYGEDSSRQSLAGSFVTVLDEMTAAEAVRAMATVRGSAAGRQTGVIAQRMIDCAFAGVLFSAHPISYDRRRLVLAGTRGRGDDFVAGRIAGEYVELPRTGDIPDQVAGPFAEMLSQVAELRQVCLRVEALWGAPVDLEWAVETGTGKVWLLQARPVVLPARDEVELTSVEAIDSLPRIVAGHSKLALRRTALRAGVPMSRAAALVAHSGANGHDLGFRPSPQTAGLSVVLLSPERVDDSVVREFAATRHDDVELFTKERQRYAIRRYPGFRDVASTVSAVLEKGLGTAWLSVCLVQEIYDAPWTGILRRTADGYLVELAQGHFVPKGVVVTSRYILDTTLRIASRDCPDQAIAYRFADGHVLREEQPARHLPSDPQLVDGVTQLLPIFETIEDGALEFGFLEDRGSVSAYLIDVAETDRPTDRLDTGLIATGVISAGRARGRATVVGARQASTSLNAHLHDRLADDDRLVDMVFLAEWASTDLLPLIYRCGRGTGFVFGNGSVLGHVGVVLRELGVPAVVVGPERWRDLTSSGVGVLHVDALSGGLPARNRAFLDVDRVPGS